MLLGPATEAEAIKHDMSGLNVVLHSKMKVKVGNERKEKKKEMKIKIMFMLCLFALVRCRTCVPGIAPCSTLSLHDFFFFVLLMRRARTTSLTCLRPPTHWCRRLTR